MIGIIGGIFGGISGSLFIFILDQAQKFREMSPKWIFILPFVGMMIPLLRGAPKLIVGSFLTHLGGGSAGREGAVIHLSRLLSERLARYLKYEDRKIRNLLIVSTGAGFGAALGTPWAGLIFGFEFNQSRLLRPRILIHSAIAGMIAQFLVRVSSVVHFKFPVFEIQTYELKTFVVVLIVGILFGFTTVFFHALRHRIELIFMKISPVIAGLIGGLMLAALFLFFKFEIFQGLGRETITHASQAAVPLSFAVKKILLSVITLGTGFQGGEFFPLAFIGSTLGSAFSFIDPSMTALLAALGFVTLYGAATKTPIACTILAYELFGWKILPYAIVTLWIASQIHQRISSPTHD